MRKETDAMTCQNHFPRKVVWLALTVAVLLMAAGPILAQEMTTSSVEENITAPQVKAGSDVGSICLLYTSDAADE